MNKTKRFAAVCGMVSVLLLLTLPAMAAGATVSIDDASADKDATTTTPINITGLTEQLGTATVVLEYNANVEVVGVTPGTMGAVTSGIDNTAHRTTIVWSAATGVTGAQTFAVVELKAVGDPGTISPLDITVTEFLATNLGEIPVTDDDGVFTVNGPPLTATRDISDQTVEPGSMFGVTLTLTANVDVTGPALDENLPAGWIVTEGDSAGAIYKASTTEWVWTAAMSSGETKIVTYNVTVPAGATPQDYDITGQASAYEVSPVTIGGESMVTVESGTTVDPISATRDISDQTVEAGSTFTVTLTLTANEDNVHAPALDENLPAGWIVTERDSAGAIYKASTTEWVWTAAMSSGETKIVTYNVTVPAGATPQDYDITGQASAYEVSPVTIGGESMVTVESGTTVDPISATRDISDQTVEAGSTFTVTLTLTANEDNVHAPALDENLPAGWIVTERDSAGAIYKASTTEWVWTAAMSSGETKIVTYNVTVPAGATPQDYDITGQASAYEVSPVTIGGESMVTVESGTTVDPISATRDISDQTVNPGSTFTVTLTLTANEDIQAPALDENLPAGWTVTEVDNGGATYKASTTEWIWTTAMSSGETRTVVYDVTVPASATLQDYYITGQASAHDVSPVAIGGESKVTVRPHPSEVPILTQSGICALIAVLCIAGAGMIVNRGRKQ